MKIQVEFYPVTAIISKKDWANVNSSKSDKTIERAIAKAVKSQLKKGCLKPSDSFVSTMSVAD